MKTLRLPDELKEKMVLERKWLFDQTDIVTRFKSPRMKNLTPLYSYEAGPNEEELLTEESLNKLEIQALLGEKYLSMKKSFEEVAQDILNQYRLHLERNQTPPDILTVSFDIHFENL
jgi:hypothetical protein